MRPGRLNSLLVQGLIRPLSGVLSDNMLKEIEVSGVGFQVSAIKKSQYQITNTKQITMTEIQNSKQLMKS
jgi:hypothetical protein